MSIASDLDKAFLDKYTGNVRGDGSCFFRAIINFCAGNCQRISEYNDFNGKELLINVLQLFSVPHLPANCANELISTESPLFSRARGGLMQAHLHDGDNVEDVIVACMREKLADMIVRSLTDHAAAFDNIHKMEDNTVLDIFLENGEFSEDDKEIMRGIVPRREAGLTVQKNKSQTLQKMAELVLKPHSFVTQQEVRTIIERMLQPHNLELDIAVTSDDEDDKDHRTQNLEPLVRSRIRPNTIYLLRDGLHYRFFRMQRKDGKTEFGDDITPSYPYDTELPMDGDTPPDSEFVDDNTQGDPDDTELPTDGVYTPPDSFGNDDTQGDSNDTDGVYKPANERVIHLKEEIHKLTQQLNECKRSKQECETNLQTKHKELSEAKTMAKGLPVKIKDLTDQISTATQKYNHINQLIRDVYTSAIGNPEADVVEDEMLRALLQKVLGTQKDRTYETCQQELTAARLRIDAGVQQLEEQRDIYKANLAASELTIANLQEQIKQLENKQNPALALRLAQQLQQNKDAQEQLEYEQAIEKHLDEDVVEQAIGKNDVEIRNLKVQVQTLEKEYENTLKKIQDCDEALQKHLNDSANLQGVAADKAQARIDDLMHRVRVLEEKLKAVHHKKQSLI